MRHPKMLALAVVGAAALAAFTAGPAAAGETLEKTVLCKVAETACSAGNQFPSGTALSTKSVAGTKVKWKIGAATIECSESNTAGPASYNSESHTPHGVLTVESGTECTPVGLVTEVLERPEIVIHHEVEAGKTDTGAVTIVGGRLRFTIGSVTCTYGGTVAGKRLDLQGGNPAIIEATEAETELIRVEGGALCANPAKFIAKYEVTSPTPLHVGTT